MMVTGISWLGMGQVADSFEEGILFHITYLLHGAESFLFTAA